MKEMQQLENFLEAVTNDLRVSPTHISLYIALFSYWYRNGYQSPFAISKYQLMMASKIRSRTTYTKCMQELNEYGYIIYTPSRFSLKRSKVHLMSVPGAIEQVT